MDLTEIKQAISQIDYHKAVLLLGIECRLAHERMDREGLVGNTALIEDMRELYTIITTQIAKLQNVNPESLNTSAQIMRSFVRRVRKIYDPSGA